MEIEWDRIQDFRVCDEGTAFSFEYLRDGDESNGGENGEETRRKKSKYVKLETGFVSLKNEVHEKSKIDKIGLWLKLIDFI